MQILYSGSSKDHFYRTVQKKKILVVLLFVFGLNLVKLNKDHSVSGCPPEGDLMSTGLSWATIFLYWQLSEHKATILHNFFYNCFGISKEKISDFYICSFFQCN